jgi:hypothetical protein
VVEGVAVRAVHDNLVAESGRVRQAVDCGEIVARDACGGGERQAGSATRRHQSRLGTGRLGDDFRSACLHFGDRNEILRRCVHRRADGGRQRGASESAREASGVDHGNQAERFKDRPAFSSWHCHRRIELP